MVSAMSKIKKSKRVEESQWLEEKDVDWIAKEDFSKKAMF